MDYFTSMAAIESTDDLYTSLVASMDGWVSDMKQFNTNIAMEAEGDNKTSLKEKVAKLVSAAVTRVKTFFHNLFQRFQLMIEAMGNRTHTKEILVPDELGQSYAKLKAGAQKISASRWDSDFYQNIKNLASRGGTFNELFMDSKKAIQKHSEEIKEMVAADVLHGRSAAEYMDSISESKRTFKVVPSKEQKDISTLYKAWRNIENNTMHNLDYIKGIVRLSSQTKEMETQLTSAINVALNSTMQFVTGMINICIYLQKYISIFIQIDKKYPPVDKSKVIEYNSDGSPVRPRDMKALPQNT